jgi:hypothetical protein
VGAGTVAHLVHEALEEAFAAFFRRRDFGDGCERAVDGVELDLVDLFDWFSRFGVARLARQVGGGDAEGVEEQAASLQVDLIERDAAGYDGDG